MQSPALPENESARLQALYNCSILDTPAEERFDRITRLAKRIFQTEIALISLVDHDRQWFKSAQGLNAKETARDISFCGHAILHNTIFQIPDALKDPRFCDNPLVTGTPHIRFYAGAPLQSEDGHLIGTFCLVDSRPRQLNEVELETLRDLANCVEEQISQIKLKEKTDLLKQIQSMNEIISRAQSQFIHEKNRQTAFNTLLNDILSISESEYGFIGEVLKTPEGKPYLKTHAVTNIAWDNTTHEFYERNKTSGLEFTNLKTLFGEVLLSGKPLISNQPATDPRRGGLPSGHPPLKAFLGLPIHLGDELVAMIGLANRAVGYDENFIKFLSPLLSTIGQLIDAARIQRQNETQLVQISRLSQVASQTTNGVIITDSEGCVNWVNAGFSRITGFLSEEILGRDLADFFQCETKSAASAETIRQAIKQQQSFCVDTPIPTRAGTLCWLRTSSNPIQDASGILQGFIAIQSDITKEKEDAQRLQHSEHRLRSIIEGTRIGTWEWDVPSGTVVFNERWAEIVGYTLAELQPISIETWLSLAHPDDLKISGEALQQHFDGVMEYYDVECRMRHKNGEWIWVHDRGQVVTRTTDGKPMLMSGTHADITARKRAEENVKYAYSLLEQSQARLSFLLTSSPVVIYTRDVQKPYTTTYISPKIFKLLGYTADEFISSPMFWQDKIHPDDLPEILQKQTELLELSSCQIEYRVLNKEGSFLWLHDDMQIVYSDTYEPLEIIGALTDISDRIRTENLKQEFISTVSHELRTPLTSINGALALIAGTDYHQLPDRTQQLLSISIKNCQRLDHLINDLLDMEKLMANSVQFNMQAQAILSLVKQSILNNQTYADQFKVKLIMEKQDDANVLVDEQRLHQILANLLSNAVKFSPEGGVVVVSVEKQIATIKISVRDQGPGIPVEFRQRIFHKFSQADSSTSRQKGGTGLGLAITKELVERMGGRINFDTELNRGSTFYVELPIF